MDADILKTEALCWLRFTKKMELIATEAGSWNADVLAIGEKHSVEIEVKVSKSDLRREFENKRNKHYLYNSVEPGSAPSRHTPNFFYFYVPWTLEEEALKLIEEHSPKAGLAVYGQSSDRVLDGKRTYVKKRPTKLHDKVPGPSIRRAVTLRMGSELCGRYVAHREMVERINATLSHLNSLIVDSVRRLSSPLEWINAEREDGDSATGQEEQPKPGPDPV